MTDPIVPAVTVPPVSTIPIKKMKLLKFGGTWCGPCVAMEKAQTLEKLAAGKSDLIVEVIDLPEEENEIETPNETRANDFDVQALPTIIFCTEDEEVILADNSGAMSLPDLEKMYQKALKKLAKT